ncbi:permease [bacterium DOLZORAL124_38_8]|nr:MAG: permease [bacterium DOLZORAL124_38_8]
MENEIVTNVSEVATTAVQNTAEAVNVVAAEAADSVSMFASFDFGTTLAFLGALVAVVLGGYGSSKGIQVAGQKAAGVMAEKPSLFGTLIVLCALPGSQGIYGLLIAIMILLQIGVVGGAAGMKYVVSFQSGLSLLIAGVIMGALALISAGSQSKVVVASIGGLAREESISTGAIVISALAETYAIFGLLIALFITIAVPVSQVAA